MISTDVSCSIRCNSLAQKRMYDLPDALGAFRVRADEFECSRCHQTWKWIDFAGYEYPEKVSCSNCYSKAVVITRVHIEIPSEADLRGEPKVRAYPSGRVRNVADQVAAGAVVPRRKK